MTRSTLARAGLLSTLLLGALGPTLWITPALACSPPLPTLKGTTPQSGETYPANAAVLFHLEGYSPPFDKLTVTVDGQPARAISEELLGTPAVRVDPQPLPGQEVSISGQVCTPYDGEGDGCAVALTYTAGEPDTAVPTLPDVQFNVYDHQDLRSGGGDCLSDADLTYFVHVGGPAEAPGASPVTYRLQASRDAEFTDIVFESARLATKETRFALGVTLDLLGEACAWEALCFRVEVTDAAGNDAGATAPICQPCYYRQEHGAQKFPQGISEPAWSPTDGYPGGSCGQGASDTPLVCPGPDSGSVDGGPGDGFDGGPGKLDAGEGKPDSGPGVGGNADGGPGGGSIDAGGNGNGNGDGDTDPTIAGRGGCSALPGSALTSLGGSLLMLLALVALLTLARRAGSARR